MNRHRWLWLVWVGFIGYAVLLAPPDQPDTFELIKNLSTGQIAGINPLVVALFNVMGVLPMIYACLMFLDGRGQKVRAFPFVLGSLGVGAFSILPYLALRQPNPTFVGQKNWFLKLIDSRWLGALLAIAASGLVFYGLTQGDWRDFAQQWQTSRFIHVMSLDFCALWLLFPVLLGDDMARRGLSDRRIFWAVALVPVLGAALYVTLRPPVRETTAPRPASETAYSA